MVHIHIGGDGDADFERSHGRSTPMGPKGMMIVGGVFVALGLLVTAWGFSTLSRAKASKSWPSVEGTVLSSEVTEDWDTTTSSRGGRRRESVTYGAEVSYQYAVDGRSYTSTRVSFGQYQSSNCGHAAGIVGRYPEGKKVDVHYDPASPGTAVLEPGAGGGAYIPLLIGVVFVIAGGASIAGGVVKKKRGEEAPNEEPREEAQASG